MCERNINWLPFTRAPTGDKARSPGMCPDQESNRRPLALWDDTQPIEPYQPGNLLLLMHIFLVSNVMKGKELITQGNILLLTTEEAPLAPTEKVCLV